MKIFLLIILINSLNLYSFQDSPLFIKNEGQVKSDILYYQESNGLNLFLKQDGIYFDFYELINKNENKITKKGHIVKLNFLNSNFTNIEIEENNAKYNYFKGDDESKWIKNISTTKSIYFNNIYEGIDLILYFESSKPRYDLILKPNADTKNLQFNFKTAYNSIIENENIKTFINIGDFYSDKLFAYQEIEGEIQQIECKFKELPNGNIGFDLGKYDRSKELIIDPIIYSTYLGWFGDDYVNEVIAINDSTYLVAGVTTSPDFPITEGAYQEEYGLGKDIFIMKYKKKGTMHSLLNATFYGGTGDDIVNTLKYDSEKIYFAGNTESSDLPMKNSFDDEYGGNQDGFVCVFNKDLSDIEYSYFVGSKEEDGINDISIRNNKVFFGGYSYSTDLKLVQAYQNQHNGNADCILGASRSNGTAFEFFTYLGGAQDDIINGIDVDGQEYLYWIASTKSPNFVTKPSGGFSNIAYDPNYNGGWDIMLGRFTAGAGLLHLCSYFGGLEDDFGVDVFANSSKNYNFVGYSMKENNQTVETKEGLIQKTNAGGYDIIFGRMSDIIAVKIGLTNVKETQDVEISTFIGGRTNDIPISATRTQSGQSYLISGKTNSSDFPTINAETDNKLKGDYDGFVLEVNNFGSLISYSSYIGGSKNDVVNACSYFSNNNLIFGGETNSSDFFNVGYDINNSLNSVDGFIASTNNGLFQLNSPQGGNIFCPGTSITSSWSYDAFEIGNGFNVYLINDKLNLKKLVGEKVKNKIHNYILPNDVIADSNYKILVEHPNGFFDVSNSTFIINQTPKITEFTSSNTNICVGDSIKLSVNISDSDYPKFNWKLNNKLIHTDSLNYYNFKTESVDYSGEYTVEVVGECSPNAVSEKIYFDVAPKTNIIEQSQDVTINKGKNLKLEVSAKGGDLEYQWVLNDGVLTGKKNPILTVENVSKADEGVYSCIIEGRCGETISSEPINVEVNTLSVDNQKEINKFIVNQNSLNADIKVDYSGLATIKILDLQGKERHSEEKYLNKGTNNIYVPFDYESGTYLFSIYLNNKVISYKFNIVN